MRRASHRIPGKALMAALLLFPPGLWCPIKIAASLYAALRDWLQSQRCRLASRKEGPCILKWNKANYFSSFLGAKSPLNFYKFAWFVSHLFTWTRSSSWHTEHFFLHSSPQILTLWSGLGCGWETDPKSSRDLSWLRLVYCRIWIVPFTVHNFIAMFYQLSNILEVTKDSREWLHKWWGKGTSLGLLFQSFGGFLRANFTL